MNSIVPQFRELAENSDSFERTARFFRFEARPADPHGGVKSVRTNWERTMNQISKIANTCDELWDERRVANYLGIAPKTLRSWRCTSSHLNFVKLGGRLIRYRRVDVESFVERRLRRSTSDPGSDA